MTARDYRRLGDVERMLPDTIRQIESVIGLSATIALINEFGGQTMFVPSKECASWHAIAEVIGNGAMASLARRYGGDELYIARCVDAMRELRDRRIRARFDRLTTGDSPMTAGAAYAALVQEHKLSDRQIRKILLRTDRVAQPDLFDP